MRLAPPSRLSGWLPKRPSRQAAGRSTQEDAGPRTFVIGDIHGEITLLRKMMDKLAPREADRLIFLGDYIDRGEDSRAVIDYLLELRERFECIFLKGNHEDMLLDYLEGESRYGPLVYLLNGGTATLESYGAEDAADLRRLMPLEHLEFLRSLLERWEDEGYIYVHAGLAPSPELDERFGAHLWIREEFIYSPKSFGKKVIFGHTPFQQPLRMANKIGIDTGAAYGNRLTCLKLPAEEFISVGHGADYDF